MGDESLYETFYSTHTVTHGQKLVMYMLQSFYPDCVAMVVSCTFFLIEH